MARIVTEEGPPGKLNLHSLAYTSAYTSEVHEEVGGPAGRHDAPGRLAADLDLHERDVAPTPQDGPLGDDGLPGLGRTQERHVEVRREPCLALGDDARVGVEEAPRDVVRQRHDRPAVEDVAGAPQLLAPGQAHLHVIALDEHHLDAQVLAKVALAAGEHAPEEPRVVSGERCCITGHGSAREIDEVLGHVHGMLGLCSMLKPGDKAPDFTVNDHLGHRVSLADLRGKTVVLWFYPKADTPG